MKRLLLLCLIVAVPATLFARDTTISGTNLDFYRPAIDTNGYFGVNGPKLLAPGQFSFRLSQGLAFNHLFEIAVNNVAVDLIDHIATTNILAAVGIAPILTVGLDVPIHVYTREADFNTLQSFNTQSLGDIRMALKFRLLEEKGRWPGLSLLATNSFPTGNEMKFLGTSHMIPGAELILGKDFHYFSAAVNVGAQFPRQKNVLGLNFDDQVTYGVGARIPFAFWDPHLSVVGEVRGHLEPNQLQIATAPVEFTAGLQKDFKNGLSISAGGGGAWNNAIGNPRLRAMLAVSYTSGRKPKAPVGPSPWQSIQEVFIPQPLSEAEDLKKRIETTVYFRPRSIRLTKESMAWVREAGRLLKDHPEIKRIRCEGHADSKGSARTNKKISLQRARAVRRILIQEGVAPRRLRAFGFGSKKPAGPLPRLNRRVEIVIP